MNTEAFRGVCLMTIIGAVVLFIALVVGLVSAK